MKNKDVNKAYNKLYSSYSKIYSQIHQKYISDDELSFVVFKAKILKLRCNLFLKRYAEYTNHCENIKKIIESCILYNDFKISKKVSQLLEFSKKEFYSPYYKPQDLDAYKQIVKARKINNKLHFSNYSKSKEINELINKMAMLYRNCAYNYEKTIQRYDISKDIDNYKLCLKFIKIAYKHYCAESYEVEHFKNLLKETRLTSLKTYILHHSTWPNYYKKQEKSYPSYSLHSQSYNYTPAPRKEPVQQNSSNNTQKVEHYVVKEIDSNYSNQNNNTNTSNNTSNNTNNNTSNKAQKIIHYLIRENESDYSNQNNDTNQNNRSHGYIETNPKIVKLKKRSGETSIDCGLSAIKVLDMETARKYFNYAIKEFETINSSYKIEQCESYLANINGYYATLPLYESANEKFNNGEYEEAYNAYSEAEKEFEKYKISTAVENCAKKKDECQSNIRAKNQTNNYDDDYDDEYDDSDEEDQVYINGWDSYASAARSWTARQQIEGYEEAIEWLVQSKCSKADDLIDRIEREISNLSYKAAEEAEREAEEANANYKKEEYYREAAEHYHRAGEYESEEEMLDNADEYRY